MHKYKYLREHIKSAYVDKLSLHIIYLSIITHLWCLADSYVLFSAAVPISTWMYIKYFIIKIYKYCVYFVFFPLTVEPSPLWDFSVGPAGLQALWEARASLWPLL